MAAVKIMDTVSETWRIENYSTLKKNLGVGESAQTRINVLGQSFIIRFYPMGKDNHAYYNKLLSFSIERTLEEGVVDDDGVDIMYGFQILNQYHYGLPMTHSSFRSRGIFRHVVRVVNGPREGKIDFYRPSMEDFVFRYIRGDSIKVRITIGLIRDVAMDEVGQREPIRLFAVGDARFCAEESVITRECPALLQRIPNVGPDMFDGILWYIYNKKKVHEKDLKAMSSSVHLDPDSYSAKMRLAARELGLEHLERVCGSVIRRDDLEIHKLCFPIESAWGKLMCY